MDDKKVYILQKDLPDYSAGEEFVFNGEHYEAKNKCEDGCVGRWSKKYVEDNPDWFRLKNEEQKPKVVRIEERENVFLCHVHYIVDDFKVISINKERLAEMLIAESWEPETRPMNKNEVVAPEMFPMVSYKEYLQFGEDCFNAARKNNSEWYFMYESFSDFMNSANQRK